MKKSFFLRLCATLLLLSTLTACSADPESSENTVPTFSPDPPENSLSLLDPLSDLFETVFVPMAQGELQANPEQLRLAALELGVDCIEENGVALIYDPQSPGSFLRAQPMVYGENQPFDHILYSLQLQEGERQVSADLTGTGALYTLDNAYAQGDPAEDIQVLRSFLLAPETPREASAETELRLFELVFLPLAEQEMPRELEEVREYAREQGLYFHEDEGMVVIQDEDHPSNYISGDVSEQGGRLVISSIRYHLENENGGFEVETWFYSDNAEYFILGQGLVQSLDQVKEHIYRGRFQQEAGS